MTTQERRTRIFDPEKVMAEIINGFAALFVCIALLGDYSTTGLIIPGFV